MQASNVEVKCVITGVVCSGAAMIVTMSQLQVQSAMTPVSWLLH